MEGVAVSSSHALTASITGGALAVSLFSTNHLVLADLSPLLWLSISLVASPILAVLVAWVSIPVTWFCKDTAPHRVGYGSRGSWPSRQRANALGHGVQYGQRIYIVLLMAIAAAGRTLSPVDGGLRHSDTAGVGNVYQRLASQLHTDPPDQRA